MNPSMLMQGVSEQTLIFLRALLLGIFLGAVYDLFRIVRMFFGVQYRNSGVARLRLRKLPLLPEAREESTTGFSRRLIGWFVFAGDVLFFLICAVAFSVFLYHYNYGIVRWYVLLGGLLGFVAYYNTVGRIVIYLFEFLVYFLKVLLRYLYHFTLHPVFLLVSKLIGKIGGRKKLKEGA